MHADLPSGRDCFLGAPTLFVGVAGIQDQGVTRHDSRTSKPASLTPNHLLLTYTGQVRSETLDKWPRAEGAEDGLAPAPARARAVARAGRAVGGWKAKVCREPLLRYTQAKKENPEFLAMVCREPLLRYTEPLIDAATRVLWFAGNRF